MKKILLSAFILILTACSAQPQVTSTLPPTSTPLPIATETPVLTITPTSIPTLVVFSPETWAGTDTERTSFIDMGGQVDDIEGVAWNPENGRVYFAKDAKGEWINYPDGNVPIPPGPGYENEPPLMVPHYHSFNEAMNAVTDELPWGELAEIYRAKQDANTHWLVGTYWKPIVFNGTWTLTFDETVDLHTTEDPNIKAEVWINDIQLPGGDIVMRLSFQSEVTDHFHKDILIFGDPSNINEELQRIDECVKSNPKAPNLADLCASDMLQIDAPAK
ncbi:MAG: hypothetical protein HOP27_03390 [Anaerolineales bacterium]|nr:hypothetical protein [Anaerolineales bacterium]